MTREEAKSTLAGTWTFERAGEHILLRDTNLIEAVQSREAKRQGGATPVPGFISTQAPRSA